MPRKVVYETKIEHVSILDEHGNFDKKLAKDTLTDDEVKFLYEQMIINRQLDEIAFKLQRSGRMGTYPQNKGQEAAALGSGFAAKKGSDYIVPCYRENGSMFLHGLPMHYVLLHWMGDERGNQIPDGVNVTPIAIPIGTQMLHATGMAMAFKIRKEPRVAVTYFGDGATSEGDFHEAMNFAGSFQAPVVFFCQNNQWAISVPRETQTNCETIAQKSVAYGMPGIQCDGNDIFAVYKVAKEAIERARNGGGPTLIEAFTYRLGDHTTADDARRYRDAKELEAWQAKDPIIRTRNWLTERDLWNDEMQQQMDERAKKIVDEVVKAATEIEKPESADFFNDMFAEMPDSLRRQRDTMQTHSLGQNPEQAGLRTQHTTPMHAGA
ncbi:MAG: pyruvate dehydrogenase (acetyl-transferring) E1 component subunit alpha [Phycisphaeraceae bacterium]|nr:pyruvate dehydrogenase (acetyl-transferring) E1 component subunit alpha [Phycisphaerales bacterium]MCB9861317.1 pyruvate dehydrogenase (acetyl-transferring) E1 component subunit alpha [Phycisphaeraceae bacterium]